MEADVGIQAAGPPRGRDRVPQADAGIEKQSEPLREEDVTNTLMKIVKGEKKTIYFTTGHGERSIDDTERPGFNIARNALEKESYGVKAVNLVTENKIPDDASGRIYYLANNVPYARRLEDGWSRQAPQGIVGRTVIQFRQIVKDAAEALP